MNEVSDLKYINSLLKEEKQTRRIQDAQELLNFVIWKLEKVKYVIRYTGYKRTYLLNDEFEGINDAKDFIDSNWFGKEKKFYSIEERS